MRKVGNILVAVAVTLMGVGAWECAAAPQAQCSTGSRKAEHKNGRTKLYECHNQEWVKVTCYDGTTKLERGKRYICRSNEWVRA